MEQRWRREMTREEIIESLGILKKSIDETVGNRFQGEFTYIANVKPSSAEFVIQSAIEALEQEFVLDKIRSEIDQYIDKEKLNFGGQFDSGLDLALRIIDKYKVEVELQERENKSCSNCKYWILDKNDENRKCKYCFEMDEWVAESEGQIWQI